MIPFKSYMEQILKEYPKIDQEEIITGLYTFINTIKIKHPDAVLANIPSKDTTYHQLEFVDANNATIGSISFKRYSNANDGIVFNLNGKEFAIKISDEGHIDLRSSYPLCGFIEGNDEVATTKYVLDAVENKASLINTSIMEYITSVLNDLSNDVNQRIETAISDLHTTITNEYTNYISELPAESVNISNLSIFSNQAPTNTVTLFSGNLDSGDIELSQPFTDFDVLFFIFGIIDYTTTSGYIDLEACKFIPVWVLKNIINSKSLFGVPAKKCCLSSVTGQYWEIDVKNSTTTKLVYSTDNRMRVWKVIGIKLGEHNET